MVEAVPTSGARSNRSQSGRSGDDGDDEGEGVSNGKREHREGKNPATPQRARRCMRFCRVRVYVAARGTKQNSNVRLSFACDQGKTLLSSEGIRQISWELSQAHEIERKLLLGLSSKLSLSAGAVHSRHLATPVQEDPQPLRPEKESTPVELSTVFARGTTLNID